MVERICNLLDLSLKAGLGRRLAEADLRQDARDPNLFYILYKDDGVEATSLAYALSVLAGENSHFNHLRFKALRALKPRLGDYP